MQTNYAYDAYRSHDLNIAMRTSSGDTIKLDFSNRQSSSLSYDSKGENAETAMSFSSMQSFSYSIDTNGIDAQDQKEIDAFMKIAQPYIDDFLEELSQDAPKSPVTQLAKDVAAAFNPEKKRTEDEKNLVQANIVELFDKSFKSVQKQESSTPQEELQKMFEETQKLLEKTLQEFNDFNKYFYA